MNRLRNHKTLLWLLSGLLLLASVDLCVYEFADHGSEHHGAARNAAAVTGEIRCDCDSAGHHDEDHGCPADHCASCLCLCHVCAVLQITDSGVVNFSRGVAVGEPATPSISDFKPGIDHPPLSA